MSRALVGDMGDENWEVIRATEVEGISPAWATGIVDPWTHFAMQAYRKDGYTPEQLSLRGRQIGYVDEKGQPTESWKRAYEWGFVAVEPRALPPIDAGMPMSGVPYRKLTQLERERADIFPYFFPFSSLAETGSRAKEGKLWDDIQGTVKWILLLAVIGGIAYGGLKAAKKI